MSQIERFDSEGFGFAPDRRVVRALSRVSANTMLHMAQVDQATQVQMAKVDAITAITGQAMGSVTRVAQAQLSLEALAPQASGRLNLLADKHALNVAEVIDELHYRLRRR